MNEMIRYLQEEYPRGSWIYAEPENYEFFRSLAKPVAKARPAAPPPPPAVMPRKKVEAPPPPVAVKVEEPPPPATPLLAAQPVEEKTDLEGTLAAIRKACPEIPLISHVPEPGLKVVLFYVTGEEFVKKVAGALEQRGVRTEVVKAGEISAQLKELEPLRMALIPKELVFEGIEYSPATLKRSWKNASVILLEDPALYEQDHYMKKALWESLKSELGL